MKKWILWSGLVVIVILLILLWQFAPQIRQWFAATFMWLCALILVFIAGWLIGRYGEHQHRKHKEERTQNGD